MAFILPASSLYQWALHWLHYDPVWRRNTPSPVLRNTEGQRGSDNTRWGLSEAILCLYCQVSRKIIWEFLVVVAVAQSSPEYLWRVLDYLLPFLLWIFRSNSDEYHERLAEVMMYIEGNGSYSLLEKELVFAAKTAWRNAPRCIGRIQWNTLKVCFTWSAVCSVSDQPITVS